MLIFSSFIIFSSLIIFKGYKFVACPNISKNNTYLNMISMAHFVRLCSYIQTLTRRLIYGCPLSTMGRSVTSFQTAVDLVGGRGSKIQSVLKMLLMITPDFFCHLIYCPIVLSFLLLLKRSCFLSFYSLCC